MSGPAIKASSWTPCDIAVRGMSQLTLEMWRICGGGCCWPVGGWRLEGEEPVFVRFYARSRHLPFWDVTSRRAPSQPPALTAGIPAIRTGERATDSRRARILTFCLVLQLARPKALLARRGFAPFVPSNTLGCLPCLVVLALVCGVTGVGGHDGHAGKVEYLFVLEGWPVYGDWSPCPRRRKHQVLRSTAARHTVEGDS